MGRLADDEHELVDEGIRQLGQLLGEGWDVRRRGDLGAGDRAPDAVVSIREPSGAGVDVLAAAKHQLTPAAAVNLLAAQLRTLRQLHGEAPALVIAPWLSPRTRDVLDAQGIGYLDFTGNVSFRLTRPAVVLRMHGAQRDPNPPRTGKRTLAGPRAGRLVRFLADFAPPYNATDIAEHSRVSLPYVSRLLQVMTEQALVERRGRLVVDVDWTGLIRMRAADVDLLKANSYVGALSLRGDKNVVRRLADHSSLATRIAVTGPAAAGTVVPLAVGGQLMLYVPAAPLNAPDVIAKELGLIRTDQASDSEVLLLRAGDDVVFERTREIAGVRHVALSQLALDSLGGTGRMPEEGDAILAFMAENEANWRQSHP